MVVYTAVECEFGNRLSYCTSYTCHTNTHAPCLIPHIIQTFDAPQSRPDRGRRAQPWTAKTSPPQAPLQQQHHHQKQQEQPQQQSPSRLLPVWWHPPASGTAGRFALAGLLARFGVACRRRRSSRGVGCSPSRTRCPGGFSRAVVVGSGEGGRALPFLLYGETKKCGTISICILFKLLTENLTDRLLLSASLHCFLPVDTICIIP